MRQSQSRPPADCCCLHNTQARAEQDAYLSQLEAEGQLEGVYGAGVQVIHADPGLVVKTKTADGTTRVYINVCTCPKVGAQTTVCQHSNRVPALEPCASLQPCASTRTAGAQAPLWLMSAGG